VTETLWVNSKDPILHALLISYQYSDYAKRDHFNGVRFKQLAAVYEDRAFDELDRSFRSYDDAVPYLSRYLFMERMIRSAHGGINSQVDLFDHDEVDTGNDDDVFAANPDSPVSSSAFGPTSARAASHFSRNEQSATIRRFSFPEQSPAVQTSRLAARRKPPKRSPSRRAISSVKRVIVMLRAARRGPPPPPPPPPRSPLQKISDSLKLEKHAQLMREQSRKAILEIKRGFGAVKHNMEALDELLHHRHGAHAKVHVVDSDSAHSVLDLAYQHRDEIPIFIVLGLEPTKPHSLIDVALAAGSKRFLSHKYAQAYLERVWSDTVSLAAASAKENPGEQAAGNKDGNKEMEAMQPKQRQDVTEQLVSKAIGASAGIKNIAVGLLTGRKSTFANNVFKAFMKLRGQTASDTVTITPRLEFLFHCIIYTCYLVTSIGLLLRFPNAMEFRRDPHPPLLLMYMFYGMMHVLAELFQYYRGDSFWSYFWGNVPDCLMSGFFCFVFCLYPVALQQLEFPLGEPGSMADTLLRQAGETEQNGERLHLTLIRMHFIVATLMLISFWRFLDMVRMFNRSLGVLMLITQRVLTRDLGSWMLFVLMVALGFELHFTTYRYDPLDERDLWSACFGADSRNTLLGDFEDGADAEGVQTCSFGVILWTVVGGPPEWNIPGSPSPLWGIVGNTNRILAFFMVLVYLLFVTIILLNLLIAMMATTYEQVERESDFEYNFLRVTLIKEYTCMGIYYAPFTLLELSDIAGMFLEAWCKPTWQWQNHDAAYVRDRPPSWHPFATLGYSLTHPFRRLSEWSRHHWRYFYGDIGASQALMLAFVIAFLSCGHFVNYFIDFRRLIFGDYVHGDWPEGGTDLDGIGVSPGRHGAGYAAFFSIHRYPLSVFGTGTDGKAYWEVRLLAARWLPVVVQCVISLATLCHTTKKHAVHRRGSELENPQAAIPSAFKYGVAIGILYAGVTHFHLSSTADATFGIIRTLTAGASFMSHMLAWCARFASWIQYDEELQLYGWEDFAAHLDTSMETQYQRLKQEGEIHGKPSDHRPRTQKQNAKQRGGQGQGTAEAMRAGANEPDEMPLRLLEFQHPYSLFKHAIEYKESVLDVSVLAAQEGHFYQVNTRTGNTRKVKRVPGHQFTFASFKHAAMIAYKRSRLRGRNANWGILLSLAENNALLQRFTMQKREVRGENNIDEASVYKSRRRQRAEAAGSVVDRTSDQ
jgi:hypothetical protein